MTRASLFAVFVLVACTHAPHETPSGPASDAHAELAPRTQDLATYPCMARCHVRRVPDPTARPLREFHAGRVVHHGPTIQWCDFCHDLANLDQLHTITGQSVSFDEAPRLCGQCHPARLRDWEHGVHGLQTGSWAGPQLRRSCTVCHDPHDPHRPAFQALPPPSRDRSFPGENPHE